VHSHFVYLAKFDLANRGMRQPVQPHTFCARLLIFDKTLAKPHFAAVNCSDAHSDKCVSLPCFNAQPHNFAVMNCCVVAFSSDILTWSADGSH